MLDSVPKPYSPKSLESIINNKSIIEHLLFGFQEKLNMGVALYYVKDGKFVSWSRENQDKSWSVLCKFFRKEDKLNCDEICSQNDKKIAKKLIENNSTESITYECYSLGLQDMAYPINIFGKTIGVLFAGQKWVAGLTNRDKIIKNITKHLPSNKEYYEELSVVLDKAQKGKISEAKFNNHFKDFIQFGQLITGILLIIANKEKQIHQKNFIEWTEIFLSSVPESITIWQQSLQFAINEFTKYDSKNVNHLLFLIGEKENSHVNLSLFAANDEIWSESLIFNFNISEFKSALYKGEELNTQFKDFLRELYNPKHFYYLHIFKREPALSFGEKYSLIIIHFVNFIEDEELQFYKEYCESLGRADGYSRLFIEQTLTYGRFENQVIDLRHDLKTTVQHVQGKLNSLLSGLNEIIPEKDVYSYNLVNETRKSLKDHSDRILDIVPPLESVKAGRVVKIEVYDKLYERLSLYANYAAQKGIQIIISENEFPSQFESGYLYCVEKEINRAIDALIDNAIKYSFFNKKIYVKGKISYLSASFTISNYGVGDPKVTIDNMTKRFYRSNIKDNAVKSNNIWFRRGSGLGLSIASYVFENLLKGQIKINSFNPHKSENTKRKLETVTEVEIILPITKGEKNARI